MYNYWSKIYYTELKGNVKGYYDNIKGTEYNYIFIYFSYAFPLNQLNSPNIAKPKAIKIATNPNQSVM